MSEDKRQLVIAGLKRMLRRVENGVMPEAYSMTGDIEDACGDTIEEAERVFRETEPDECAEWGVCVPLQWFVLREGCEGDEPEDYDTESVDDLERQPELELRPRRTLADVVANPPSGWRCELSYGVARFKCAGAEVNYDVGIMSIVEEWVYQHLDEKARAAAHRAVADLLDVLAEVSDE